MTTLREKVAEALWQDASMRAMGRPRNITWDEVGEDEKEKWRHFTDAALAAVIPACVAVANSFKLGDSSFIRKTPLWAVHEGACIEIAAALSALNTGAIDEKDQL